MIGGDRQNTRETTADHSVTQSPDEQHVSVSRLLPSWFRNRYPPPEPRRQFYFSLILERMARGEGSEASAAGLLSSPDEGPIGDVKQKNQRTSLTVCNKICYAIGGTPYQITGSALGFFLQLYLLDVAQLDPFYASIILFVGRAWDAVTDPTVGFMVSRSKWTSIGRMMPWILFSTPFAVITYILLWFVFPFENGKFIWCLIFYCLFQTMQTCFHVPYSALTMFITSDQKERDSATAYRMMVEVLGSLLGTAVQGQIVGGSTPCNGEDNVTASSNVSVVTLEDTVRVPRETSCTLSDCFRCHLHHLRPQCSSPIDEKRRESNQKQLQKCQQ